MSSRTDDRRGAQPAGRRPPAGRVLVESLVFLALAVTLFRWCVIEGYLISTGSMATCLLGDHRRVSCPSCGFEFAVGVPGTQPEFARAASPLAEPAFAQASAEAGGVEAVACPNCDLGGIRVASLPVTEGDQLLVHKGAFRWHRLLGRTGPRRWDVVVFRNPESPQLTYVKRVVGLPGETITLRHGDVYADGALQRKPLAKQLGTRILVHADEHEPSDDDPDWQPRWLIAGRDSPWEWRESAYVLRDAAARDAADGDAYHWVGYRHWIRRGGAHRTEVVLSSWPESVPMPDPLLSPVEFDAERERVRCFGALPRPLLDRWLVLADEAEFRQAAEELYRRSHVAPITDRMVYNAGLRRDAPANVRDLMLELRLTREHGAGVFAVELTTGRETFTAEFDFSEQVARLRKAGADPPVAVADLPTVAWEQPVTVQMSTFDRQVLVAIDGELLLGPHVLTDVADETVALRRPARFGGRGLDVQVDRVRLYRDVYYAAGPGGEGVAYPLPSDEYFVLGDNSAVSIDSRHWDEPGVREELLVGKPLLVHLPSRSRRLNWGEGRYIRVPDVSRIRYIH